MNTTPAYDEILLLTRLAAGDSDAFSAVYDHYQEEMQRFLLRFVKSTQLAEDLSQEIFLRVWEDRARIKEVRYFRAWLFIVARNHTLNMLKSAARSPIAMGEISLYAQAGRDSADDRVLLGEYGRYLQKALEALPPRSREVFRLCREQNQSYDEVARALGISRNSVKNHMVLSMKLLRTGVEKDLGISLSLFLLILHGR